MNHQRYPFPSQPGDGNETRGRKKCQNNCLVIGASNHTWHAPKAAHTAALDRHSLWQKEEGPHADMDTLFPGTDLLRGYNVLLVGEFDQPNHSKRTAAKRKRDSKTKGGGYCTPGNISLLLQLCGANVYGIESMIAPKQIKKGLTQNQLDDIKNAKPPSQESQDDGSTLNDALQTIGENASEGKVIVMVKDKSEAKLGTDLRNQLAANASSAGDKILQIPVVSCQWLLDSIGDFVEQDIGKYI